MLFAGVLLYAKATRNGETIQKYGHGTPDDWLERHVYSRYPKSGVVVMALIDIALFGVLPGLLMFAVQMVWIPFWAAGVINGLGHYWGYRNFPVENASTNLFPWGILIGGEELHNNHHAYATSARFSSRWFEFDVGWMYIRALEMLGLAHVRHVATVAGIDPSKTMCDAQTLAALVQNRYFILARYTQAVRDFCMKEAGKLKAIGGIDSMPEVDPHTQRNLARWLRLYTWDVKSRRPIDLEPILKNDPLLQTVYSMRHDLSELWVRSHASTDQLVVQLREWCQRAESSGIAPLRQFSRELAHLT